MRLSVQKKGADISAALPSPRYSSLPHWQDSMADNPGFVDDSQHQIGRRRTDHDAAVDSLGARPELISANATRRTGKSGEAGRHRKPKGATPLDVTH